MIYHVTTLGWCFVFCVSRYGQEFSVIYTVHLTNERGSAGSHGNINTVKKLHKKSFSCSRGNEVNYKIWLQFLWRLTPHNCGLVLKNRVREEANGR